MKPALAALLCVVLLLGACGQMGPLVLPDSNTGANTGASPAPAAGTPAPADAPQKTSEKDR